MILFEYENGLLEKVYFFKQNIAWITKRKTSHIFVKKG